MIYYSVVDISLNNGQGVYARKLLEQSISTTSNVAALIPEPTNKDVINHLLNKAQFIFLPKKEKNKNILWHLYIQILSTYYFYLLKGKHHHLVFSVKPTMFSTIIARKLFSFKTFVLVEGLIPQTIKKLGLNTSSVPLRIVEKNIEEADVVIPAYSSALNWINTLTESKADSEVIRCGVDYSQLRIEEPALKSDKLIIGYVGSFNSRHRLDLLINASAQISNLEIILIGDGDEFKSTYNLAEELHGENLNQKFKFLGNKPHSELSTLLAECDVMWGLTDNSDWSVPIKVYESLACNKYIVAKYVCDFDFISSENIGYLINDVNEKNIFDFLQASVKSKLTNPKFFEINSRQIVSHYSNWNFFGDRIKSWLVK